MTSIALAACAIIAVFFYFRSRRQESSLAALKLQLARAGQNAALLSQRIAEAEEANDELDAEIAAAREEIARLYGQGDTEADSAGLADQLANREAEISHLREQFAAADAKAERFGKELSAALAENEELRSKLSVASEENERLTQQCAIASGAKASPPIGGTLPPPIDLASLVGSHDLQRRSGIALDAIDCHNRIALLVEDNFLNRELAKHILELARLKVEVAENGREAVDKFTASPVGYYSIIFMDIRMPIMNGNEATIAIRALDRADAKTVPILAMTGNTLDSEIEESLKAGMNQHLAKPVDIEDLAHAISHWVGGK